MTALQCRDCITVALTKTKFCTLFPNGAPPGICMACDAPSSKRPRYTVLTPGVALRFRKGRNGGAAGQWTCMTYQMRSPIFLMYLYVVWKHTVLSIIVHEESLGTRLHYSLQYLVTAFVIQRKVRTWWHSGGCCWSCCRSCCRR